MSASTIVHEREKLAQITEQHYNRSQKIDLKAEGMTIWVKTLLATCDAERKKLEDIRSSARRSSKTTTRSLLPEMPPAISRTIGLKKGDDLQSGQGGTTVARLVQ